MVGLSPSTVSEYISKLELYGYKVREMLLESLNRKKVYTLEEVKMVIRMKEIMRKERKDRFDAAEQVVNEWQTQQEEELKLFQIQILNESQELEEVQEELDEPQKKKGFFERIFGRRKQESIENVSN